MENYHVIDLVGEGSFGKVYKGRRKCSGKIVALKFILKHGKSEKDIKSLRQEIEILRTLCHENVIRMLDSFETKTDFVVVTEFAQGELFEILSDDTKLPENVVQSIAKQLINALHYLHSHRVIHRDMKPQNILIAAGGVVKLCDFGFARALSTQTMMLTSIKGTPLYMAPELVQEHPYTYAVDLWSVGVILYELYVGQPPFFTSNIYSLIHHIVRDPVKYPSSMSTKFKSLLQGLLTKDPRRRLGWPALLEHPFIREDKIPVPVASPRENPTRKSAEERRVTVPKHAAKLDDGSRKNVIIHNRLSDADSRPQSSSEEQAKKTLIDRIVPGSRDITPSRQRNPPARRAQDHTAPSDTRQTFKRPIGAFTKPTEDTTPRVDAKHKPLSRFAQLKQQARPSSAGSPLRSKALPMSDKLKAAGDLPQSDTIPAVRREIKAAMGAPITSTNSESISTPEKQVRKIAGAENPRQPAKGTLTMQNGSTETAQAKPRGSIAGSDVISPSQAGALTPIPQSEQAPTQRRLQLAVAEDSKENRPLQRNQEFQKAQAGVTSDVEDERRRSHSEASTRDSQDPSLHEEPSSGTMLGRMLTNAGARATSKQGAEALLGDSKFLSLVLGALRRPASGTVYTQWASGTDLLVAAKVGANVLKFCHARQESGLLLRSLLSAAQACLAIQPKTTADIAKVLYTAEAGQGQSFISFEDTSALYADLVGQRGKQWQSRIAGCSGLSGAFRRAQAVLSTQPPPAASTIAAARGVIDLGTRGSPLVPRLCCCLEDSLAAAESPGKAEAMQAALECLSSLVHTPGTTSGCNASNYAPVISAQNKEPRNQWQGQTAHASLLEAVKLQVAESLLGYRDLLTGLTEVCLSHESMELPALQIVFACAQASPAFCEAIAVAKAPQKLLKVRAPHAQSLALTTVALLAHELGRQHQRLTTPAVHAFLPSHAPEQFLSQLTSLMKESQDKLRISACASAIVTVAALLSRTAQSSPDPTTVVRLPACLYQTSMLQAVHLVLDSKPQLGPPAWEGVQGAYCKTGLLDGPLAFCSLLIRQDIKSESYSAAVAAGLPDAVLTLLQTIGGVQGARNVQEIYPPGVLSLLEVLQGLSNKSENVAVSILTRPGVLPALAKLLDQSHLKRLGAWGTAAGGGAPGICSLVAAITELVINPYCVADMNTAVMFKLNKAIGQAGLVGQLVRSLEHVHDEQLNQPLLLLTRLVNMDPQQFIPQFQDAGGLQCAMLQKLLRPENPADTLAPSISLISLIARHHGDYYAPLAAADVCYMLKPLLQHTDAGVRSRTCNLIGNLCRHLPTFYQPLQRHGLLPILIDSCSDNDRNTRKFACFAIGNAAFYDDTLYEALRGSCVPLVHLILHDKEEKTRANAAGAIGNLVRSSGVLCDSLIAANAPQALLQLAATPLGARGGAPVSDEPMKVALFSLGNMCTHAACAQSLLKLGLVAKLRRLSTSPDTQVQKHCSRIQAKLQVWLDGTRGGR